jgi:hypothetical protein
VTACGNEIVAAAAIIVEGGARISIKIWPYDIKTAAEKSIVKIEISKLEKI